MPHVFAVFDRDILPGIVNQQLRIYLAGPKGVNKQVPNSLPSDEHSTLQFKANDAECELVSYDNCICDLDKLVQDSVVVVKGRLCENIAFWRSIGASQWLLNVLCESYCLPLNFVGFPVNKFFPNHKSASCHAEFVSAEISISVNKGGLVFKFDYSSGYHHLEIFPVIPLFWAFCDELTVIASSTFWQGS